eukprot:5392329-Prymnesium_polylepis.2
MKQTRRHRARKVRRAAEIDLATLWAPPYAAVRHQISQNGGAVVDRKDLDARVEQSVCQHG